MICFVVLFGSNVVGLLGSVVVEEFVFCDDGSLLWMTAGKKNKIIYKYYHLNRCKDGTKNTIRSFELSF